MYINILIFFLIQICCNNAEKCCCGCINKDKRVQKNIDITPQSTLALQWLNATQKPIKFNNDNVPKTNLTTKTITYANMRNINLLQKNNAQKINLTTAKENPHVKKEDILMKAHDKETVNIKIDNASDLDTAENVKENLNADLSPISDIIPLSNCDKDQAVNRLKCCDQEGHHGLLNYRRWWELIEVEMSVSGKLITGIPIFIEKDTLRVINDNYSYFIPLEKVDYIRTKDGLRSSFDSSNN